MRLLFDEQLSSRPPGLHSSHYPGSLHVEHLGLLGAGDLVIWHAALSEGCILVSKDEDFHRLSVLRGAPPKVIWLRSGNGTTQDIADLLSRHASDVAAFAAQDDVAFLELGSA